MFGGVHCVESIHILWGVWRVVNIEYLVYTCVHYTCVCMHVCNSCIVTFLILPTNSGCSTLHYGNFVGKP